MAIDLLGLQPTKISRDLKGKYMLFYGLPKCGKTSLSVQFPNSLLCAFEKGYNGLAGIKAVDMPKWTIMKETLKSLKNPQVQEMYDTIIIDTAAIAWEKCEEYVCIQNDVSEIGEIPYGKGYKLCTKEFNSVFREITMLGYGLVFITHSDEKPLPDGKDGETFVYPSLEKRAYKIVNGLVDVIGYIGTDEDGQRFLYTRSSKRIVAGSRFGFLAEKIPLNYDSLVDALVYAIEKEGSRVGTNMVVDERIEVEKMRPFFAAQEEAKALWTKLTANDNLEAAEAILKVIENTLGQKARLSDINEHQQDLLELIISDMKDM